MSWIPSEDSKEKADKVSRLQGFDVAVVTSVPDSGNHVIETKVQSPEDGGLTGSPTPTWVVADVQGDINVPQVGDTVIVGRTANGFAVCFGILYTRQTSPPSYTKRERIIGHPFTDAEIKFSTDGTVSITANSGDKIDVDTSDGSVRVNDGSNAVVYDASVDTTKDGDGHVTSVTLNLSKSSKLKVPG